MAILQFAFDSDLTNPFLPHNLRPRTVVYTRTHDNDTSWGWWGTLPSTNEGWRWITSRWTGPTSHGTSSVRDGAPRPRFQWLPAGHPRPGDRGEDELPSRPAGNWRWRWVVPAMADPLVERLASLNAETGRLVGADQRSARI